MYQVCTRYLIFIQLFFPVSVSFAAFRARILKECENLHVHFEDCVGRRVTSASGAFLELDSSSGSSSDAFHINIQYLRVTVMFFQLCPFPTPGIPSFAPLTVNKIHIYDIYQTLGIMCYLHPLPHHQMLNKFLCIRKPAIGGLTGRRRSPLYEL